MASDAPTEIVNTRRHQMFPVLTESEIARISRFGTVRRYQSGARLFAAGAPGPGMLVVLKGVVTISQRDGLGHVVPVVRLGPGEFSGEIAQLSGRHGLVDGYAEEEVETLLVPPRGALPPCPGATTREASRRNGRQAMCFSSWVRSPRPAGSKAAAWRSTRMASC
jgi:CRP-like cAMP-binding protein